MYPVKIWGGTKVKPVKNNWGGARAPHAPPHGPPMEPGAYGDSLIAMFLLFCTVYEHSIYLLYINRYYCFK